MAQAADHVTTKNIEMDFVASQVLALADGVLLGDQEQILAAAKALADECDIPMPEFCFVAEAV